MKSLQFKKSKKKSLLHSYAQHLGVLLSMQELYETFFFIILITFRTCV